MLTWLLTLIFAAVVISSVIGASIHLNSSSSAPAHVVTAAKHETAAAPEQNPPVHTAKDASVVSKLKDTFYDVEEGDPPGTAAKLKLAAMLAAQGANCASVTLSTYIPPAEQYPEHKGQPYYVTCDAKHGPVQGFAYGVYFTEADLKTGVVKNQEQPIAKDQALLLCRQAILGQLRYPSSADFSALTAYVSDNGTTNREIVLRFTALNGLGNRVPQRGRCIVEPNGHTDVTISDR